MSTLLKIKLVTVADVAIFNSVCNSIDCKTTLRSGNYVVDAKSLMGIFSLNLSNPVTLELSDSKYADKFSDWAI